MRVDGLATAIDACNVVSGDTGKHERQHHFIVQGHFKDQQNRGQRRVRRGGQKATHTDHGVSRQL